MTLNEIVQKEKDKYYMGPLKLIYEINLLFKIDFLSYFLPFINLLIHYAFILIDQVQGKVLGKQEKRTKENW